MEIRPIRSDDDHKAALAEVDRLWGAEIGTEAGDKLDVLLTLVEKYEEAHWPINDPNWDPVDVLQHAIDEMGHSQAELGRIFKSRSRASEILNRERTLTLEMIRAISEAWQIPAALLIKPYRARVAA